MPQDPATIIPLAQRPDLRGALTDLFRATWPPFVLGDPLADEHWHRLYTTFADTHLLLLAEDGERVAGAASTLPFAWSVQDGRPPEGWDDALALAVQQYDDHVPPTTLLALAFTVAADDRHHGHGAALIRAVRGLAAARGLDGVLAHVRLEGKTEHPQMPLETYLAWRRDDGTPFDPWLRAHLAEGGQQVGVARCSLVVSGTLREWEHWTGRTFPDSGRFAVPGGLAPVAIDRWQNLGRYEEPGVWVRHAPLPATARG